MIRRLLLVALLALWGVGAQAQIAFINAADQGNNGGAAPPYTTSYTVATDGNTLLVCFVGALVTAPTQDDIGVVSYSGISMSLVQKNLNGSDRFAYCYILANAPSGAHNIVVNFGVAHFIIEAAAEYSGTALTGQPDNSTTAVSTAGANTLTTNLTTVADNCWTFLFGVAPAGGTAPTAGAGSTQRAIDAAFGSWAIFDSNAVVHPAGSNSMTFNDTNAGKLLSIMASLAPGSSGHFLPTQGIGQ